MSNTVRSVTNVTYDLDTKNSQTYRHGSVSCSPAKKRKRRPYDESCDRSSFIHFRRFDYVHAPPLLTAIRASEAHNLPRYIPEGNKQDFMRWSDSDGELVLHKIRDVASALTSAPLGCTYDSSLDTFVFTLDDSILFASSHGEVLSDLTIRGFQKPSAICIIQPGAAMAILDHSKLYLYEAELRRLSVIASDLNGRHRGANTLTCMEFTGNRFEKVYSRYKQLLPVNSSTIAHERFMFMSGIRCDGSGHLFIADAKARTLKGAFEGGSINGVVFLDIMNERGVKIQLHAAKEDCIDQRALSVMVIAYGQMFAECLCIFIRFDTTDVMQL
ncbi:unnamed protein product [Angiostrongylus costaricensis]|uniref:SGL domain-containing protein n=1 Tax=Angiostrongylus costaricensis TaxID=334426 RepID=A0A158PLH1_ANGCS|nr:unnamed protein product [Angiostrongylus costaricensis]